MSVDTVNEAVTNLRLWMENHRDFFMDNGATVLRKLDNMRIQLMREDIDGFVAYVQIQLRQEPDAMDFILEEIFTNLQCKVWEDFEAVLRS